jgi:hypothetical protein
MIELSLAPSAEQIDDEAFLRSFEACTLPFAQWTHRCHVRLAWTCLDRHSFDDALVRVRNGIQRYNRANDRPGYHETMTVAWVRLVAHVRATEAHPSPDGRAFCDAHPELGSSSLLLLFYSRAVLFSPAAKEIFVEPDLPPVLAR